MANNTLLNLTIHSPKYGFLLMACLGLFTVLQAQPPAGSIKPFNLNIPQAVLTDLKLRLQQTRWPDEIENAGWDYGANLGYMKALTNYWANGYDWRKQERALNELHHYTYTSDGRALHFIHEPSKGSKPIPVVLLHGWPSSFVQMLKIIPQLTNPATAGENAAQTFHVVVPSLPGYGFSDKPTQKGTNVYQMAVSIAKLMTALGYEKFMVRGSDIGAGVAKELALTYPERVVGVHLSGSNPYVYQVPDNLTEEEKKFITNGQQFMQAEGAYAMQQSTKPQTLAYGLTDSPAGLAAWMLEKFRTWSDCSGELEKRYTRDELLTNITLYWVTGSIHASMRAYYESAHTWSPNGFKRVEVPTAFFMLAKDIAVAPRSWEARFYNVQRWNVHPSGGHFAEWEEPAAIAADMRAFAQTVK